MIKILKLTPVLVNSSFNAIIFKAYYHSGHSKYLMIIDTKIKLIENGEDINSLQKRIYNLFKWGETNDMFFNNDKVKS